MLRLHQEPGTRAGLDALLPLTRCGVQLGKYSVETRLGMITHCNSANFNDVDGIIGFGWANQNRSAAILKTLTQDARPHWDITRLFPLPPFPQSHPSLFRPTPSLCPLHNETNSQCSSRVMFAARCQVYQVCEGIYTVQIERGIFIVQIERVWRDVRRSRVTSRVC